jgi:hypothetical protein
MLRLLLRQFVLMQRLRLSLRTPRPQIHILPHTNIHAHDNTAKHRKSRFGLIVRNHVSGVVYPGEGQVAKLAHLAADVAFVDDNVGVSGGGEGRGVGWNEV